MKNENQQYINDKEGEIRKKINFTDIIKKVFKQSNIKIDQQKCFEYFQIKKYSLINDQKSSVICFVNISHKLLLNNKNELLFIGYGGRFLDLWCLFRNWWNNRFFQCGILNII